MISFEIFVIRFEKDLNCGISFLHLWCYCKGMDSVTERMNCQSTFALDAVLCQNCTLLTDWLTSHMYCDCTKYIMYDYA